MRICRCHNLYIAGSRARELYLGTQRTLSARRTQSEATAGVFRGVAGQSGPNWRFDSRTLSLQPTGSRAETPGQSAEFSLSAPFASFASFAPFASFASPDTARTSASRNRAHGFTLLELIVAVAVFAVVATLAYSGLDLMLRSRSSLEAQAERQRAVELAVLGLERDLRQALARPVRGPYGDEQAALVGSANAAEWTVLDLTSSRDGVHPMAGRVRYAVVDGALWRARDPVLDRSPRESARNRRVLEDVQRISWRYLASARQRLDQWPPRTGITAPERLPRAVEVTLVLQDRGEISRLIELPESPR